MDKFKTSSYDNAYLLLKEAEKLLNPNSGSAHNYIITMNNLASYYKKTGNLRKALIYLTKSLEKESELNDSMNLAATHLNISSLYSVLTCHELSINHCQLALTALKKCSESCPKVLKTQILANNTLGTQYQALSQQWEAAKTFKYAWELSKYNLGVSHPLTLQIEKNLKASCKRSESVSSVRISRNNTKSTIKHNYNKTPSCDPRSRERLPNIIESRRVSSKDQGLNWELYEIGQDKFRPHIRRPVQGVDAEKIATLNNLIEEISQDQFKPHFDRHAQRLNPEKFDNIQNIIEEIEGKKGKNIQKIDGIKGILKTSRNCVKVDEPKKGNYSKTLKVKEIQIKNKVRECRKIEYQSLGLNIDKENKPVAVRTKVRFCRKNETKDASKVIKCAIMIWVLKERKRERMKAVIIIQKNIRCISTRRLYKRILNAVKFIQTYFRGYLVRKSPKVIY